MKTFYDKILDKIEKIAKDKEEELESEQYHKYFAIYELAFKILKTQKVILYGGMAINDMLPKKYKIYKSNKLPDIDVFGVNAIKICKNIIKKFTKQGYPVSNYSDALHPGTYKIFVHGLQIIDISDISSKTFKRLSENSVIGANGVRIINPQFIRMSFHMLLSQPNDAYRWTKTFERLVVFNKVYPPKNQTYCNKPKTQEISDEINSLNTQIYDYLKKTEYVAFGLNELQIIFNKDVQSVDGLPLIQILVKNDIYDAAEEIISNLDNKRLKISKIYEGDDFIPRHVFINYGKQKLIGIYTANVCVSYTEHNGYRVASIHTLLRMYFLMLLSTYDHFDKYNKQLECLINSLLILEIKNIGDTHKIFKEFVTQCYGIHRGLITLKRERYAK